MRDVVGRGHVGPGLPLGALAQRAVRADPVRVRVAVGEVARAPAFRGRAVAVPAAQVRARGRGELERGAPEEHESRGAHLPCLSLSCRRETTLRPIRVQRTRARARRTRNVHKRRHARPVEPVAPVEHAIVC